MKYLKYCITAAIFLAVSISKLYADCSVDATGRVSIVGNDFPAIHSIVNKAAECASNKINFKSNLTADHKKINIAGMQGKPAEYTAAIIATSSLVTLMNEGLVRPLNDLVEKYGGSISLKQLINVDGKIVSIAFLANAQHLIYRADVLKKIGVDVPKSYEEVLAAANKIREQGIMQYPLSGAYKTGWDLGEEFINIYIGYGGEFFKPGTAQVTINNSKGIATLNMMKALTQYMNPDYLTHANNDAAAEWEAGNVAMMNFWGSRAFSLMDKEGSTREVYSNTKVSGPLMVGDSGIPATTLWWDGFTIAKNISDEDAKATFLTMLYGASPALLNEKTMGQAVWMIDGYKPSSYSKGVFKAMEMNAKPYPMFPQQGLLHIALGNNIADFLQGKESAKKTLADIEASYIAAAKEKGFL